MNLREQLSDPARCWVRYAWRPWPGPGSLWTDLFTRGLGARPSSGLELDDAVGVDGIDDVIYLAPTSPGSDGARRTLAKRLAGAGAPFLVQSFPGETSGAEGGVEIVDLLEAVVTRDLSSLEKIPAGANALWPLIAGYSDETGLWTEGLEILRQRQVECVLGMVLDLTPADRRRVVDTGGDRGFEALFHGTAPSERDFAIAVHGRGLTPFLERPLPTGSARLRHNRWLAGELAAIGDLWLRLERSESAGQSFFRAARWIDRESHDLVLLAREGNLGVVTWLDEDSRRVVEEMANSGSSELLSGLRREYLSGG